jgi:hypothetical protein
VIILWAKRKNGVTPTPAFPLEGEGSEETPAIKVLEFGKISSKIVSS